MKGKLKKYTAIILVTLLMLTQLSVLFPLFPLFNNAAYATDLTPTQINSFDNQKWLIDEIIKQVRVTRPTISDISQVTLEELQTITIINLDGISATGSATGQDGHIPSGIGLLTGLTNLTVTNTNLNASTSTLTGNIPTEIGNLTKLQVLDLRSNNLTGAIPTQVGSLTNLTYLNLSDNALSGTLPSTIFSSNLAKVTYLSFANNQLTGSLPNPTTNMTALQELNLSGNKLTGAIPANFSVTRFPALVNVNLSHNSLNAAIGTAFTTSNTTLQYIDLSYCGLSGTVGDYSPNSRIIYLNLSNNNFTGSFPIANISKLATLKYLYLGYNNFTAASWNLGNGNSAKCPLEVISIPSINATGFCTTMIPANIQASLRELDLSGNNITSASMPTQAMLNGCVNLEKLDVSNNQLTTMLTITTLTKLKYFDISGNNLTSLATNYFASNNVLEEIYINNNNITGALPTISHLTGLSTFNASNNSFNGGFPNLSTNVALKTFNVSNNKLSGRIPSSIEVLTNLVELNISNNEFVGSLSSWVKALPSVKRDKNFLVVTEPSQKSVTPEIVNLDLIVGESVTLKLGADNDNSYNFSSTSIWDITASGGSSSIATVTQASGSTFTVRGVGLGSAEYTVGLQGRDTSNNDNAQTIIRINIVDIHGVLVRYVERGNSSNVIYQETHEDIPNGTVFNYTAPDTFSSNGDWARYGVANRSVTLSGQYAILTIEYDKIMAPVTVTYVEQGSSPTNILKTISTTAQVGSIYTPSVPDYYTKPENVLEGEYRLVPGQSLSLLVASSGNNMIVNYQKNMSYDQVTIRYVFIDPTTGTQEIDLVPLGYYQVGTMVYYRLPSTYMRNGLWKVERDNLDISYMVLQTGNTITVECSAIMTATNQIVIRYVNSANTSQILQTASPNPVPQQKGSTYTFTVPATITTGTGASAQNWSVVLGTTQSVLIADSTQTQYIDVLYSQGLTNYNVTINYVEKGNTGHLLQDTQDNNYINPVIVGSKQVGSTVSFTAPDTIDEDGVLWQIVGGTSRNEIIGATNYQLIVEYEPVLSSSHVLIKYVEDGNTTNEIATFDVGYQQIGSSYQYTVPETYLNNGLWNLVGDSRF